LKPVIRRGTPAENLRHAHRHRTPALVIPAQAGIQ
jgi:hypothetical protein